MKGSTLLRGMAGGLLLAMLTVAARAEEAASGSVWMSDPMSSGSTKSIVLAAGDEVVTPAKSNATVSTGGAPVAPRPEKDPWLSTGKIHQYLGITTLALAAATVFTAPEGCEANCANYKPDVNGTHAKLGRATRAAALAAVATGIAFHWDDMHLFEDGLTDPDTLHWLLGGAGALLLANAVSKAPNTSHARQAELGAAMMLVAVKLTW